MFQCRFALITLRWVARWIDWCMVLLCRSSMLEKEKERGFPRRYFLKTMGEEVEAEFYFRWSLRGCLFNYIIHSGVYLYLTPYYINNSKDNQIQHSTTYPENVFSINVYILLKLVFTLSSPWGKGEERI